MTPLYEVWQALWPEGYGWMACWEGNHKVALPLPRAKAYAAKLAELSRRPTEVRGRGRNYNKIKAVFGMEAI